MSCMKCGKKLGASETFCDECLEKMEQCPIDPSVVVKLPQRTKAPTSKKKTHIRRYFWNPEDEIGMLRSKLRWVTFALVVAILGFLLSVGVIIMLLHWHGRLDFLPWFSS